MFEILTHFAKAIAYLEHQNDARLLKVECTRPSELAIWASQFCDPDPVRKRTSKGTDYVVFGCTQDNCSFRLNASFRESNWIVKVVGDNNHQTASCKTVPAHTKPDIKKFLREYRSARKAFDFYAADCSSKVRSLNDLKNLALCPTFSCFDYASAEVFGTGLRTSEECEKFAKQKGAIFREITTQSGSFVSIIVTKLMHRIAGHECLKHVAYMDTTFSLLSEF
ncbi:hypothetical protein Ciccas_013982 [Cichlidogyrus casuarinus]|uniref:Uncharacterized protein n=1 Tax=Cichlidogyrus casuarinus TaxID=1844966 RepID=A0ABD2PJ63_9PLAT